MPDLGSSRRPSNTTPAGTEHFRTWYGSASATFINVFVLWCINYLAQEIEQPFGKKVNDLPLDTFMHGMNNILIMLLEEGAAVPPRFDYKRCIELRQTHDVDEDDPAVCLRGWGGKPSMRVAARIHSLYNLSRFPRSRYLLALLPGHLWRHCGGWGERWNVCK